MAKKTNTKTSAKKTEAAKVTAEATVKSAIEAVNPNQTQTVESPYDAEYNENEKVKAEDKNCSRVQDFQPCTKKLSKGDVFEKQHIPGIRTKFQ